MSKNQLLFSSRIIFILIAFLLNYQTPGNAGYQNEQKSVQYVFAPVVFNNFEFGIPEGGSVLKGVITDSRSGQPIDGGDVCLNGSQICEETNIDGAYELVEVPAGFYTLTAEHPNYEVFTVELSIFFDTFYNIQLLPFLEDGQFRVVLTWDSTPSWGIVPNNLDLHLWLRNSGDYHIYEGNVGDCSDLTKEPYACYEKDAQYGSGPDAIVFADINADEEFSVAVLHYFDEYNDDVPSITELDVVVGVYDSQGLRDQYTIAEVRDETGDLWYVFDLSFDEIERQSCLQQYDSQFGTPPVSCP